MECCCLNVFHVLVTASIGICLGYHRYLTHRGFTLPKWLAYFVVFCGNPFLVKRSKQMGWQQESIMRSDTVEDPHSAEKGFWWSHFTWMLFTHSKFDDKKVLYDYTKDFSNDKFYRFLDNYFIKISKSFLG
ncbi:MAG: hypothetical protein CM1200mP16_03090 [Nitrospina sp.]|nr:MAG: hypothetical protein CM1200mP16_03090 [Nitrospina sp.]